MNGTLDIPETIEEMKVLLWDYHQQNLLLREQIEMLKRALFAPKSEKNKFDLDHSQLILPMGLGLDEITKDPEAVSAIEVPAHTRRKRGRKPIPDHLPRVEIIHDLPEDQKLCECGKFLKRIGEEVSEKLDYVPAVMQVERHIRPKYACPACDGMDDGPTVRIAPMPPQIIPKGIATPNLLAQVITAKFADALPFYRQTKQFARLGVDIPRHSMSGWVMAVAKALEPVKEIFQKEIRSGPLINMDETSLQVLGEPGRSNTSKSFLWLFHGGNPKRPTVVYLYNESRSGTVPRKYLGNFKGYIQTDGYAGYNALGESEGIIHAGCMAHIRRKFMDVHKATSNKNIRSTAKEILDFIGLIYKVEYNIKELSLEDKVLKRQELAVPILESIKDIIDRRIDHIPPKSLLGKAMIYAKNQWSRAIRYIDCGLLTPDNNKAENAIRPVAVGRKNWLFAGAPKGAHASALMFTLVETAKANEIEPQSYLKYLLANFPLAKTKEDMLALMPQYVDRSIFPNLKKKSKKTR